MGTPGPHRPGSRPRQVGPAIQKTHRLIVSPTDLVAGPLNLVKTIKKIPDDLIWNDYKTWRARQDIGGFRPSRLTDMQVL
jgi:hypothetical protein